MCATICFENFLKKIVNITAETLRTSVVLTFYLSDDYSLLFDFIGKRITKFCIAGWQHSPVAECERWLRGVRTGTHRERLLRQPDR